MKRAPLKNLIQREVAGSIEGVRVGIVTEIVNGQPLVDFAGNRLGPLQARYTGSTNLQLLEQATRERREVLLVFENSDAGLPIIIDVIHSYLDEMTKEPSFELQMDEPRDVTVDGRRVSFKATDRIELRCGKSSIVLTRAGKIIIRGAYLLNRSSGVNRIKGGSVQIN